jgi:hypothetical protein
MSDALPIVSHDRIEVVLQLTRQACSLDFPTEGDSQNLKVSSQKNLEALSKSFTTVHISSDQALIVTCRVEGKYIETYQKFSIGVRLTRT